MSSSEQHPYMRKVVSGVANDWRSLRNWLSSEVSIPNLITIAPQQKPTIEAYAQMTGADMEDPTISVADKAHNSYSQILEAQATGNAVVIVRSDDLNQLKELEIPYSLIPNQIAPGQEVFARNHFKNSKT